MAVSVMHWVCSRCKWLPAFAPVWCGAGIFTVNHVGGNGQDRGGWNTAPVGVVALYIAHENVYQLGSYFVYTVVIVSVFGEISLYNIIYHDALVIADCFYLCILDGR